MILFHGLSDEEIRSIIGFLRSSIDPNKEIALSMTVPNVMEWEVQDLIEHVLEEHRQMKGNKPNA